jgi:peptide/nickel transport system permease protein
MIAGEERSRLETPLPETGAQSTPVKRSRPRQLLRALRKNKNALAGLIIVAGYVLTALAVAISSALKIQIEPYNPLKQFVGTPYSSPSLQHLMGTDQLGRDVFSRVLAASPNDVGIGLAVVGSALILGGLIGSYAAYRGGILEEGLMRVTDVFFGLPALVLAMAIAIALGRGILNMTFVLMIIWWPVYARLARGEALKVSHQNYIEAARLSGTSKAKTLFRHIVPNISATLLVYATLDVGGVVLAYAGLSYVGLSVTPPAPDWGQMVNEYQDFMIAYPYLTFFPGLVISLIIIGWSLLGDGLRDALALK